MPITFVIVNNNGISGGPNELDPDKPVPAMALTPRAHYERMIEGFGGLGFYCETPDQIGPAMQQAFESGKPAIVNIAINPRAGRKPQQFAWLTR
jgi:thiamine pyrophosphate-dependent acetolactate synthase large subunit-like protein